MPIPSAVGRYRIDRVLGAGAFASVWLGHDDALASPVAIKVLSPSLIDDLDVRNRFLEEARILRRADSERLIRVHDIGELPDGRPYFVMPYADRGTLADRMRERQLTVDEAIALAEQIAYGVEVINRLGIIHRDLKPSNVLFQTAPDGTERLLIADLGLAKALAHASGAFTLPVGTPGYMSPEQARFGGGLDVRADVYGLGALTYHLVTGRAPGPAPVKVPPSQLRSDLGPEHDDVILRAMAVERDLRWPTAEAFARALAALRPGGLAEPAGPAGPAEGGAESTAQEERTVPNLHDAAPAAHQDGEGGQGGHVPPPPEPHAEPFDPSVTVVDRPGAGRLVPPAAPPGTPPAAAEGQEGRTVAFSSDHFPPPEHPQQEQHWSAASAQAGAYPAEYDRPAQDGGPYAGAQAAGPGAYQQGGPGGPGQGGPGQGGPGQGGPGQGGPGQNAHGPAAAGDPATAPDHPHRRGHRRPSEGRDTHRKLVIPMVITAGILLLSIGTGLAIGKFSSGKDTGPAPTPPPKNTVTLSDASGRITVTVPREWPKGTDETWTPSIVGLADARPRPVLRATPDVVRFRTEKDNVPGVFIGETTDAGAGRLPPAAASQHPAACTSKGTAQAYKHGTLSGTITRWSNCNGGKTSITEVGLTDAGGTFGLWIRIKQVDGTDRTKEILDSVKATAP